MTLHMKLQGHIAGPLPSLREILTPIKFIGLWGYTALTSKALRLHACRVQSLKAWLPAVCTHYSAHCFHANLCLVTSDYQLILF